MQVDFQSLMSGFSAPVDTGDPIKSIYGIIPYMDSTQMHLKFQLMYFIEKYNLSEWRKVFEDIDKQLQNNKNINFFSSQNLKALLSAYTQNELVRGIKVNTLNENGGGNQCLVQSLDALGHSVLEQHCSPISW